MSDRLLSAHVYFLRPFRRENVLQMIKIEVTYRFLSKEQHIVLPFHVFVYVGNNAINTKLIETDCRRISGILSLFVPGINVGTSVEANLILHTYIFGALSEYIEWHIRILVYSTYNGRIS